MFGVFREEPSNVVWRFSAEAAADARQFRFHPDQILTELPDGRLEVAFRAGGLQEMAWHLFRWGGHVEIVSPPELRAILVEMLETALAAHRGTSAGAAS
jgi:predicted DNA-binding transcriptional regulator YafY